MTEVELRPRLRGVFHLWAFVVAVVAGIVLVALRTVRARWSRRGSTAPRSPRCSARAPCTTASRGSSTARRLWARRLDHSMIFVFIAGTNTPFALPASRGPRSGSCSSSVWAGAALGPRARTRLDRLAALAHRIRYLAGRVGRSPSRAADASAIGVPGSVLVIVGGVLYTAGSRHLRDEVAEPVPAHPSASTRSSMRSSLRPPRRSSSPSRGGLTMVRKVELTEEEWRARLTPEQYAVLRGSGHRAAVHRRVPRHRGARRLPVRGVRRGALSVGREVPFGLRLAELRRAVRRWTRSRRGATPVTAWCATRSCARPAAGTSGMSSRTGRIRPGCVTASTPAR